MAIRMYKVLLNCCKVVSPVVVDKQFIENTALFQTIYTALKGWLISCKNTLIILLWCY